MTAAAGAGRVGSAIEGTRLKIGDVFDGKYRIERLLGVGGMGIVLEAANVTTRDRVALKLMQPQCLENPITVARFEREAKAIAKLRSDHVTRVVEVGRVAESGPYIALEFLDGSNLEELIERDGPLPCDLAASYLLQACDAIAEAHSLKIIHRDLKPDNLFLTKRGDGSPLVKVLDFGISKMEAEGELDLTLAKSKSAMMGSPLYAAPEQLRNSTVDERADIWSLGAILFLLVTGRTPFDGATFAQLSSKVLRDPPRNARRLRPDIPDGLVSVIKRCLQKDPADRFQRVSQLSEALEPFALARFAPAKRKRSSWRTVLRIRSARNGYVLPIYVLVAILASIAGAFGLWRYRLRK